MKTPINNRYDFMLVFDVKDGNPNGDPDAGNQPRMDYETMQGIVSDVCLKRKIRNYVEVDKEGVMGYDIFVKSGTILNRTIREEYERQGIDVSKTKKGKKSSKKGGKGKKATTDNGELFEEGDEIAEDENRRKEIDKVRVALCDRFYDIRTFGAVMTTGLNAGQVRGPVQLTFARSVDPISMREHCIGRVAITKEEDEDKKTNELGRKTTVPYGLYVAYGFVSPGLAKKSGFSEEDLELLWKAIVNMFEYDRSAARGLMAMQKLIIFKHETDDGNARAQELFRAVKITKKEENKIPRDFADYEVEIPDSKAFQGVEVIVK